MDNTLHERIKQLEQQNASLREDLNYTKNCLHGFIQVCADLYRTPYQEIVSTYHTILYDVLTPYRTREWLHRKSCGGDCEIEYEIEYEHE